MSFFPGIIPSPRVFSRVVQKVVAPSLPSKNPKLPSRDLSAQIHHHNKKSKVKRDRSGWAYSLIYIWSGLPRGNYYRFAEKHGSLGSTRSCRTPTRDASGFQRQKVPLDRIATMIRQNWCASSCVWLKRWIN